MNPWRSFKKFFEVRSRDRELSRVAKSPRGWYVKNFYRMRLNNRRKRFGEEVQGNFIVADQSVTVHIMAEQLGSLYSIFADREYDLRELISFTPRTILDLGADTGMATVYLSAQFREAQIAAVEPDPRNVRLLNKTIESNSIADRVTVFNGAIASQPGKLRLRMGENSTCSALETSPLHSLKDSVEVEVTTVPALLDSLGWTKIDLLKIDIEGTEDELLSARNEWLHQVGTIILEIHPNTTVEKIQSYLNPFGFSLKPLHRGVEPVFIATRNSLLPA